MPHDRHDRGFTLIEMLVSVTLVLLMMTMFAQVFQMAGGSISKQRGLAENDQRSRTLQTILKADLDKRTVRWVYPFAADEDVSAPESYVTKRQGYLYISENNPTRSDDDMIQFTVLATMTARNKDQTPYYGKATNFDAVGVPFSVSVNQPDADDAQSVKNDTGLSTVAEVAYYLRNGNLYRRQLLVREPLATFSITAQPTNTSITGNNDLFDYSTGNPSYPATGPFWNDFDYSAYRGYNSTTLTPCAQFLGTDNLDNSSTSPATIALAKPQFRFGFSPQGFAGIIAGRSKEFADASTSATYFGRYTMQECSDPDFRYPQSTTSGGNTPTDPSLALTLDPLDGTVIGPDDFSSGPRRGEDLLLSNVHEFDIQIWDANAFGGSFVNIGDPALATAYTDASTGNQYPSDYSMLRRQNTSYGPRLSESLPTVANACFDTWHPVIDIDGALGNDNPPFHPTFFRPSAITGGSTIFDKPSWQSNQLYDPSDPTQNIVFPTTVPNGWPFYYRCIQAGTSDNQIPTPSEPIWPKAGGLTVRDGTVVWQAVENRKPLRAIKIEVRFVDPSTQQMRQLTLIQSLVD